MSTATSPARRLAAAAGLLTVVLLSCGKELTAPGTSPVNVFHQRGTIAFNALFETPIRGPALRAALTQVAFERVRITLRREDGTIALDTVVNFPVGADSLTLSLIVPLPASASSTGVPLNLNLNYVNAAGDTVFKGSSPLTVIPSAAGSSAPPAVNVPVVYSGTGANASAVIITPKSVSGLAGQSSTLAAQAVTSTGTAIAGTPIVFSSSNPAVVTVPNASSGAINFVGRGTAKVYAELLTGPKDSSTVTVTLPAARIAMVSGDGQNAFVNEALSQPIAVRVTASDGIGVGGVHVGFSPLTGGSVSAADVVTAADGTASASWTLGPVAGAQQLNVFSTGLLDSPITFNATARAAVPTRLVIGVQPQSAAAGRPISTVTVHAQDDLGNIVTNFTGSIVAALNNNPGGGTLGGTTTVAAVGGIATFSTLSIAKPGVGYALRFSSGTLSAAVSSGFDVLTGPASRLVFTSVPTSGDAVSALAPVVVTAQDDGGNTVIGFTGSVTLAASPAELASSLTGTLTRTAAAGAATFNDLRVSRPVTIAFAASATGLAGATSAPVTITTGAPSVLTLARGGGQTMPAGATLDTIVVHLADAGGNPVAGRTIAFAVTAGGGTVAPASATTDANGRAWTFWTVGSGAQKLSVSTSGVTAIEVTATGTAGAPATLHIVTAPAASWTAGAATPAFSVEVLDAHGNRVTTSSTPIVLSIASGPAGALLFGAAAVTPEAGVASFNDQMAQKAGAYTLKFASGTLPAITTTMSVVAGPAATILADSGNAQSASVNTSLGSPFVVFVTDAYANVVSGERITWAVTGGGGAFGTGVAAPTTLTNTTDVNGRARTTLKLGGTAGTNTVTAAVANTGVAPATFTATGNFLVKVWTGLGGDSLWTNGANWTLAGVPSATDSVRIDSTAKQPGLSGNVTVAKLTIANGAKLHLNAYDLTVGSDVIAGGNSVVDASSGSLILAGTNASIVGPSFPKVTVAGRYELAGGVGFMGSVFVTSGSLNPNGNAATINGDLVTSGTGVIGETTGAITVAGNANFGGTGTTSMTGGTLAVSGDFTASATAIVLMAPPHLIKLNGVSAQTISLASGGSVVFSNVEFSGAGAKSLATGSQMRIDGTGFVLAGSGAFTGTARTVLRGPGIIDATAGSWNVDSIFTGPGVVSMLPASLPAKHFQVASGSVQLSSDLSLPNANVQVFGALNPNGWTLTVGKNLLTSGSGIVVMQTGASSLTVKGNATFAGGNTSGQLTAGTMTVFGNLTQSTNPGALAASPGHTTVLADTAAQTVTFANPDTLNGGGCAASCLGNLTIAKASGGVTFLTASNTQGNFAVDSASWVSAVGTSGSPRLVAVKGNVSTASGTNVYFSRLFTKGVLSLDTTTSVDSIGYGGTASQLFLNRTSILAVMISGTPLLTFDLIVPQSLSIRANGVLDPNGHSVTVHDSLVISSGGRLAGSRAADSVDVLGIVQFTATAGTSAPSSGKLVVRQDVALQSATALQSTGTHTVVFARNDESAQHIVVTAPRVSGKGIHHAVFSGWGPKELTGEINFMGDVTIAPSVFVVSPAGGVAGVGGTITDSTTVALGGWRVDSTEFAGTSIVWVNAPTPVVSTNMAVTGHFTPTQDFQLNGNLTVTGASGIFELANAGVTVMGDFATRSGGVLKMNTDDSDPYLGVMGSAVFAGGSTAGLLTAGWMEVLGDFTQGGGAANAFAPADSFEVDVGMSESEGGERVARVLAPRANRGVRALKAPARQMRAVTALSAQVRRTRLLERHAVRRAAMLRRHPLALSNRTAAQLSTEGVRLFKRRRASGSSASVIQFANPCASDPCGASSYFGALYLSGSEFHLNSDLWVTGQLMTGGDCYLVNSTTASQHTVTSHGADVYQLEFDNIRWVLLDGKPVWDMYYVVFDNMDPAATQFTIQRAGDNSTNCDCSSGHVELDEWSFYTTPTTGYYIAATETRAPAPEDALYLDMWDPYPTMHGGHVLLSGAGTNWAASFAWTGVYSTNWNDGSNWSTGYAPGSSDDVTIPAGLTNYPRNVGGPAEVHNLTIAAGATIDLSCNQGINVYGNVVSALGAEAVNTCEGEGLNLKGDGSAFNTIVGNFNIVYVYGKYRIAGPGSQLKVNDALTIDYTYMDSSSVSGDLMINGGRLDAASLETQNGGTLTMTNAADQVFIGSGGAYFYGGASMMTAGRFEIIGGVIETCGECGSASGAFAPTGTHKTVFSGGASTVNFDSFVYYFFNDVQIESGSTLALSRDAAIHGTLSHGTGAGAATVSSESYRRLEVSGLSQTGAATPMIFSNAMLRFSDGTSNATFDNVTFQDFGLGFGAPMFEFARSSAGTYTFSGLTFTGTLSSTGLYLLNSGTQNVSLLSTTPTSANAMTACGGGCINYKGTSSSGTISWLP